MVVLLIRRGHYVRHLYYYDPVKKMFLVSPPNLNTIILETIVINYRVKYYKYQKRYQK